MNAEINRIKWKCRRGMRELDLLLREFSANHLNELSSSDIKVLDEILDYDDQTLFDFVFKDISLGNSLHEKFIVKNLKSFTILGNL